MLKQILKDCRALLFTVALVAAAAVPAQAVDLYTGAVDVAMPDGAIVTMWGYGLAPDAITVPGPTLDATDGGALNVTLHNNLPVPVSLVIRGLGFNGAPSPVEELGRVRSFNAEAAPNGGIANYSFNARAGSFIYESGTDPAAQVPMGLYGAVRVAPAAAGQAYDNPNTAFDQQAILLLSEVDPAQNAAVFAAATSVSLSYPPSTTNYAPRYFLVNGAAFDPLLPLANALYIGTNADTVLLRLMNAGSYTRMPFMQGEYMRVIAEDGYPKTYQQDRLSVDLPAGSTKDVLVGPLADGDHPFYDRRLYVTNSGSYPGGMLSMLVVAPTAPFDLVAASRGASFSSAVLAAAPTLGEPADGSALPAATPATFTWTGDAGSSFTVEISRRADFGRKRSYSLGTETSFTPNNRQWRGIKRLGSMGRTLYWRVKADNGGDVSYSGTNSFTIVR